jgi:hypothetical protein
MEKLEPWRGVDLDGGEAVAELDVECLHAGAEGRNLAAYLCYRNEFPIQPTARLDMPRVSRTREMMCCT